MTRLQELTDDQKILATILLDRARGLDGVVVGPGTVGEIREWTAWPGERPWHRARVARVLRELSAEGLARRASSRGPDGVRWELDERGWVAAGGGPLNRPSRRRETMSERYAVVDRARGVVGIYPDLEAAREAAAGYGRGFPDHAYEIVPSTSTLEADLRRKARDALSAVGREADVPVVAEREVDDLGLER